MAQPAGKKLSDYEKYIRTEELLSLQKPKGERVHPDELLFQVIHQSMELWMKEMYAEHELIVELLDGDALGQAAHHLRRVAKIETMLATTLPILETMAPADYHVIRLNALGRGSGQESPGFNAMLRVGEPIRLAFERARARRGISLKEIFAQPRRDFDLWLTVQAMMEMDEGFQSWRHHHYQLVKREIGLEVKSLKDVPAAQLRFGVDESFFPELWAEVPALTRSTRPEY